MAFQHFTAMLTAEAYSSCQTDCVDSELKQALLQMEERINDRFERVNDRMERVQASLSDRINRVETSLNDGIERVETSLNDRIERVQTSLDERIERVETSLNDRIERVETSLLTAFHQWSSPVEARQRSYSYSLRALDEKIEEIDDRVRKLEGRPPLSPHQ